MFGFATFIVNQFSWKTVGQVKWLVSVIISFCLPVHSSWLNPKWGFAVLMWTIKTGPDKQFP